MEAPAFTLEKMTFKVKGICHTLGENVLFIDGVELTNLAESQAIHNASPDGPSWGYGGSGPAQAALMICLHIFKHKFVAQSLYQSFKAAFVAHFAPNNQPFETEIDITDFLIENRSYSRRAVEMEELARQIQEAVNLDDDWQVMDSDWQPSTPEMRSVGQRMLKTIQEIKDETPAVFRIWHVGERVLINHPQYAGKNAIIYDVYYRGESDYGISLLTEEGENLGGWEPKTWRFLEYDLDTEMNYTFTNVMQLNLDYINDLFTPYFNMKDY